MDLIVGLEIHIQLKTNSKMFCSCSTDYFGKEPNINTCPSCLGLPGALPVANKRALELCILLGLAANCSIAREIRFDRKHYFYPDLPKGYQISQYDEPLCYNGHIDIRDKTGESRHIDIQRIHQEEDVAKSFHLKDRITGKDYTLIDYNKSGVPLAEIVTYPVIRSASEAKLFATKIRQIVRYLNISDADMEKGQMRCEPNISVQEEGKWKYEDGKILPISDYKLNPKVEVKNIGSISAVEKAIDYEYHRLVEEISNGGKIVQQTRGWNAEKQITEFQRTKESAEDYRYFKEPDIPTIIVDNSDIEKIKKELVELPDEKYDRYVNKFKLSNYDAEVLTASRSNADFFENLYKIVNDELEDSILSAKLASNWITGVIFSVLNKKNETIDDINVDISTLKDLIIDAHRKDINLGKAKELLTKSLEDNISLGELYKKGSNKSIDDDEKLIELITNTIKSNEKAVLDYKGGKENAIGFLIGQVMKASQGNARPDKVKDLLIKELKK